MTLRVLAAAGALALGIAGYLRYAEPPAARASSSHRVAHAAAPAPTALADGPKAAFGADCAADAECASGACSRGKQESFCSMRCAKDADCPSPPTSGACNNRGFCKR